MQRKGETRQKPDERALTLLAQAASQGAEAMQARWKNRLNAWRDAANVALAAQQACIKAVQQCIKEGCDDEATTS